MAGELGEGKDVFKGLVSTCEDFTNAFEKLSQEKATSTVSSYTTKVLDTLKHYIKDKTLGDVAKDSETLQLHAAALPYEDSKRELYLHLADFAQRLFGAGCWANCLFFFLGVQVVYRVFKENSNLESLESGI